MKPYLSVIIPAYNEEKRILATLIDIDRYLLKQNYDYEIIVVNDGSTDDTVEVVRNFRKQIFQLKAELPRTGDLKIIDNKKNHGKGYVVKQGMLEAQGKYRLFMDADNSTAINHLDKFWPFILPRLAGEERHDVVIGSIEVSGAKIHEEAAWYRRLLGKYSKYIIRIISGLWDIRDSQRGFKLFTANAAEKIFLKQTIVFWGFDIEILVIAKKMGFKIKEVAIDWKNSGESKVTLKSYFKTFIELLKIKWNLITRKYD